MQEIDIIELFLLGDLSPARKGGDSVREKWQIKSDGLVHACQLPPGVFVNALEWSLRTASDN